MHARTSPVLLLLVIWATLYLAVGVDLGYTQGNAAVLDWTRIWAFVGLAAAPASFLLGWRVGTRDPRLMAGLMALASVLLAVFTLHVTIFRAVQDGQSASHLPLSGALLFAGLAIVGLTALVQNAGWSAVIRLIMFIAVVGTLVLLILPNFVRYRCQGVVTACKSNQKHIATALEMYATDNAGRFPPSLEQLTPAYIKTIPTCLQAGRDTYSDLYDVSSHPDAYTVFCAGNNHYDVLGAPDLPMYTSTDGLIERLEASQPRKASPYLHAVRVGDEFLWVQALLIVVGILLAFDPSWRMVGLGLVGFAVIPWSMIVRWMALPADDYNHCVTNLWRYRRGVKMYRAEHPRGVPPRLEHLKTAGATLSCPRNQATYRVTTDADGRVTVSCDGDSHNAVGCPSGYPRFTESDNTVHRSP